MTANIALFYQYVKPISKLIDLCDLTVESGGNIQCSTESSGNAGDIFINTSQLKILNGGMIEAAAVMESTGDSGNITVDASESVIISLERNDIAGGMSVNNDNIGNGGTLSIDTPLLIVENGGVQAITDGSGKGGDILLNVHELKLMNTGQIVNYTTGKGDAGNITIHANKEVFCSGHRVYGLGAVASSGINTRTDGDGNAGNINITTPLLTMADHAGIELGTQGKGDGGNITIRAEQIRFTGGSLINASTLAAGNGGTISIKADDIHFSGFIYFDENQNYPSGILALTKGSGNAGNIDIEVGNLILDDAAQISAITQKGAAGDAGKINIVAGESVSISKSNEISSTIISTESEGSGKGGDINVSTPALILSHGFILSSAEGSGDAGNISIDVGTLELENGAQIRSGTDASGQGGPIDIKAGESIVIHGYFGAREERYFSAIRTDSEGTGKSGDIRITSPEILLDDEGMITAYADDTGDAGRINIDTGKMTIGNNSVISTATFADGHGGEIVVDASDFIVIQDDGGDSFSGIASSSSSEEGRGNGGKITIRTPSLILSGGLI